MAVLQSADCRNRDLLTALPRGKVSAANEKETAAEGSVSLQTGMAVHDPDTDASPADVIQRAVSGTGCRT